MDTDIKEVGLETFRNMIEKDPDHAVKFHAEFLQKSYDMLDT
jgi:hypothetical protein